jgi:hypothetical protein
MSVLKELDELEPFVWYTLDQNTQIMKVSGGWVIRSYITGTAVHQVYVPDTRK